LVSRLVNDELRPTAAGIVLSRDDFYTRAPEIHLEWHRDLARIAEEASIEGANLQDDFAFTKLKMLPIEWNGERYVSDSLETLAEHLSRMAPLGSANYHFIQSGLAIIEGQHDRCL
jgi:hypothetical protein